MEDGYGRFLLVFGFAMGSDRAAFADGCARQEAGGRPPGSSVPVARLSRRWEARFCDFVLFHPTRHPDNLIIESKWQQSRAARSTRNSPSWSPISASVI